MSLQQQFEEENRPKELVLALHAVLDAYRHTGQLVTSQRLLAIKHDHHPHRESDELKFVLGSQVNGKDKTIPGDGNHEKATSCTNSDFETGTFDDWVLA